MRDDQYPSPVSDPEAEGLPDTADDDSRAYDDVDTGRWADGPDPAALPPDHPQAVDRFGTTAEEQRAGESLDYRLSQEEPDVQPEDPLDSPGARWPTRRSTSRALPRPGWTATCTAAAPRQILGPRSGASAEELAVHETDAPDYR